MDFIHHKLGYQRSGAVVEVTLQGSAANVRLMTDSQFRDYQNGRAHRYIGGLARQSPVRLQIPNSGTWHVAVDMQGLRGNVRSAARVIPAQALRPLPPIRETRPALQEIADQLAEVPAGTDEREYDVFISHASEDKDALVRPLADALTSLGVVVWYDDFTLRVGDSLRRKIDQGIASSRFGIVVLSDAFFKKGWPQYELDGLVTRAVSNEQIILPLWHGISKDQVMRQSPSLADKVALRTSDYTVEEIANELADVIRSRT